MHTHRVPQRHGSTGADEAIPGGMRWHTGSTGCARPGSTGADDLALKLLVHRSSAKNRNNAMPSRDQFLETYGQRPLSRKRLHSRPCGMCTLRGDRTRSHVAIQSWRQTLSTGIHCHSDTLVMWSRRRESRREIMLGHMFVCVMLFSSVTARCTSP